MEFSLSYDEHQMETIRKVNRIINGMNDNQSVCIYGTGEHTAKLIKYTNIMKKYVKFIAIEDPFPADEFALIKISSLAEIDADPPDLIVISSYERQEEFAEFLLDRFGYGGELVFLYDKHVDRKPFFADVFRSQTPPPVDARWLKYVNDLNEYFRLMGDHQPAFGFTPILGEDVPETPIQDLHYYYQDTWGAGKIFADKPECHVDVGSSAILVGILSQFTRVCSVDIRPLTVNLNGLECRKGSIVALPFANGELRSLSSLCVIEHIGLGRYGDEIDPWGREKAIRELKRVLAVGGNLYVSVPIGVERIVFNAEEIFDLEKFLTLFSDLRLVEAKFIFGNRLVTREEWEQLRSPQEETVGLFHFRREKP